MFTPVQRAGYLGASDMGYVMNDDVTPEEMLAWWEVKVGLREPEPPTYPMKLGAILGDVILDRFAEITGDIIERRQDVVPSPVNKRFRSTIDGMIVSKKLVTEAKFASSHLRRERIFSYYYAQVAMQMHCTDANGGLLIVGQGTSDPFEMECIRDTEYERVMLDRAGAMLECMDTMTPPVEIALPPAPVPPEKWRTIDLATDRPNWADEMLQQLDQYRESAPFVQVYEQASKAAKALVPDDVGRIYAGEYTLTRNKKNVIAITSRKSA